jgi:hypothetical protein
VQHCDQSLPVQGVARTSSLKSNWLPSARDVLDRARADPSSTYDTVAFRVIEASQRSGAKPLQTLEGIKEHLATAQRATKELMDARSLYDLKQDVEHRPIDLTITDATLRYEVGLDTIVFTTTDAVTGQAERWKFSMKQPPKLLLDGARDRDAPPQGAQLLSVDLPGARWLPLTGLVASGQLKRMQDWPGGVLRANTESGHFYVFVSHRWLTPLHPDPEGMQASLIAWQLLGYLCEAIQVAAARGLDVPRRFHPAVHAVIGVAGSELAESILVHVLRPMGSSRLGRMLEEVRSLEPLVEDHGVAASAGDQACERLRRVLGERPTLAAAADRINLWYDYSCMPQEPRTPAEQAQFEQGLRHLNILQGLSFTAVLLDEVTDYMGRGWCVLESVFADSVLLGPLKILRGSHVQRQDRALAEWRFRDVLEDRPHLIWRGVLDTALFRIQSPAGCMARLGLETTRPEDLDFVYKRMQEFQAPSKVHIDDCELVTGFFPVPVLDDGETVLLVNRSGRELADNEVSKVLSLDWTRALDLQESWLAQSADELAGMPALAVLKKGPNLVDGAIRSACHVAIVASCEGEAVMVSSWVHRHVSELAALVKLPVDSISWIASDIAPVGHFIEGGVSYAPVAAEIWVVIAPSARLLHCSLTSILQQSLKKSGQTLFELTLDASEGNLVQHRLRSRLTASDEGVSMFSVKAMKPTHFAGGVFREELLEAIARNIQVSGRS